MALKEVVIHPISFLPMIFQVLEMRLTQPEYSYKVNLDKAGYQKITGAYSFLIACCRNNPENSPTKSFFTNTPDALDTLAVLSA